jgi:hypothetical protein
MPARLNYAGIHKEPNGAMSRTGNIIRDAWVFDLIPESQTCEGWSMGQIEALYDQVSKAWEPHGHMVSNLPDDLRQRHGRIYAEAINNARAQGWDPEDAVRDEQ